MIRARAVGLVAGVLALSGCGEDDQLTVSAASSLSAAFQAYGESFEGEERFSFAGSDELAAQIRSGAAPDVFASANMSLTEDLYDEGLVEKPVMFISNTLVLAVPTNSEIDQWQQVAQPSVDLVIGAAGVPVGDYTREVLSDLPGTAGESVLANTRSEEPDVKGIVGKLVTGAADAGFVYASDVAAAADDIRTVELPTQPNVAFGAAAVTASERGEQAREFIDGLLDGDGREALLEAGFIEPEVGS